MKRLFILLIIFSQNFISRGKIKKTPKIGSVHPLQDSYKLIWQDEFKGEKLDRSKWTPVDDSVIGKYGHGNGEAQAYLDAEGDTFFKKWDITSSSSLFTKRQISLTRCTQR